MRSGVVRFDVSTHVHHQMAWPVELVSTDVTLVWFDPSVGSHVLHKAARQHKLLATPLHNQHYSAVDLLNHSNFKKSHISPKISRYMGRLGSRVVSMLDSGAEGSGFKSQL